MKTVSALDLRQSLGRVLKKLAKTGEPMVLTKDRKPAAVLISLEDYKRRFVDVEADQLRVDLVDQIKAANLKSPKGTTLQMVKKLRRGR